MKTQLKKQHKINKRARRFDRAYNALHAGWGEYPRGVGAFDAFIEQFRTQPLAALKAVGF